MNSPYKRNAELNLWALCINHNSEVTPYMPPPPSASTAIMATSLPCLSVFLFLVWQIMILPTLASGEMGAPMPTTAKRRGPIKLFLFHALATLL